MNPQAAPRHASRFGRRLIIGFFVAWEGLCVALPDTQDICPARASHVVVPLAQRLPAIWRTRCKTLYTHGWWLRPRAFLSPGGVFRRPGALIEALPRSGYPCSSLSRFRKVAVVRSRSLGRTTAHIPSRVTAMIL